MMNSAHTFMSTPKAAQLLNLSPRTLEKMRVQGRGPVFRKLGRKKVVYAMDDLLAWADAGARRSTSDPGPDHDQAA
ncbi:MAG: helix-turn-helix domain-containing protein [Proteobacteria bacterium]|nr:helix-turn-helix domain-containing protein [Pseudomonadota bacterium]